MALNKAQLMEVPGGPGVVGAVKAGTGITIDLATGAASVDPGAAVTKLIAGQGVSLTPATGVGDVTISTAATSDIPSGSKTLFPQAAAPTGWVKDTSFDNATIRIVSGSGGSSGGSVNFTEAFTSYTPQGTINASGLSGGGSVGATSISVSQMPAHAHSYASRECSPVGFTVVPGGNISRCTQSTQSQGGNSGHTHGFTGSISGSASFTGTATNQFAVKYVDAIVCTKS